LKAIRLGWVCAFMVTLPIAGWELWSAQHLPTAYSEDIWAVSGLPISFAATTLGNRNTYVTFITVCLPFILWSFSGAKRLLSRLFYLALAATGCALISINSSRLGMITVIVQIVSFLWLGRTVNTRRKTSVFLLLAAILLASAMAIRESAYSQLRLFLAVTATDESIAARAGLYKNGLLFIVRSHGLGVGAGGFEASNMRGWDLYDTHTAQIFVVNAHNLWLEVVSEYGVVVGGMFIGWLGYCFLLLFRASKKARSALGEEGREAIRAALVLLIGLPTACLINSSFLTFTVFWSGMATIAAISVIAWRALQPASPAGGIGHNAGAS
jgi:O-antigen ligase